MPDLWPEDFGKQDLTPPVTILREQAQLLGKKTGGAVIGQVETGRQGTRFEHQFYVVAPSLENYTYLLFAVTHPIQFYPLRAIAEVNDEGKDRTAADEDEFLNVLKAILASDKTRQIINAIGSQVETDQTIPQAK